jgi:endo-1,3(4)-beta-glucanase
VAVRSSDYTPTITASASHNSVFSGADNLAQALDGRSDTRWSTRAAQRPGMWFVLDLNQVRPVGGLSLDSAGSPNDYPRGYVVRLSSDHNQWTEVARNDGNDRALDITFDARPARYIRVEQTGSADQWWWSIHGVTVKS